jgi:hypothetical protein
MVKAIDYTSKGDDDDISILLGGTKSTKIKKKFLTNVLVEKRKLNEVGVYNSETDIKQNPKTDDNTPDELTGFLSSLRESIEHVLSSLNDIKSSVMDNSDLSYDSLDICMSELKSYLKSLSDESEVSASSNPE